MVCFVRKGDMMATEDRKRLIWKGKIVGEAWLTTKRTAKKLDVLVNTTELDDLIWIHKKATNTYWLSMRDFNFESFEQGIKVGDELWFDKDRGDNERYGKFTLVYESPKLRWKLELDDSAVPISDPTHLIFLLEESERIGSIHDADKEEKP